MAVTETYIAAPPERVFEVLSDPTTYGDWVVGTTSSHEAEGEWPAEGSKLRWTTGLGPIEVGDVTTVTESQPPHKLAVRAELGRLGAVGVVLELDAEDGGTRVRMFEKPVEGVARTLSMGLTDLLTEWRNVFSLDRLRELAEAR